MLKFLRSLYLSSRLFYALFGISLLFLVSFWFSPLYPVTWILTAALAVILLAEIVLLYRENGMIAERILPEKFSNSDENIVQVSIRNRYNFPISTEVIDEIPVQFQKRDFLKKFLLPARGAYQFEYLLRPLQRGVYIFGNMNVFAATFLKMVKRRYVFNKDQEVKVYPSFIQMKKLDFLASDRKVPQYGLKKIRRIGHTMEFEQIKEYVRGDDVRTINWKASAKHSRLMVNQFQDEKAQPVYSIIDGGRLMKMPFEGLSLLDYAINSSLAFSNVALKKKDRVGFMAFSKNLDLFLKANSRYSQLNQIMELLYNLKTDFLDSDFGFLYSRIRKRVPNRSLLMLYTNFEHVSSLKRQLPYLKAIAKKHLLVVIFFENTEVLKLTEEPANNLTESAHQVMAEQFVQDKKLMLSELQKHGIQAVLTKPKDLSTSSINKYLEIKARGLL
ncbi:MAG: DUF58 domain-containing protein [Christiangramia sp.]|uniref:DUF58 domain-containing protein n=1 Tax=Christiangramia sp. TaxID=1931228 RepID=UPI0032426EF6